MYTVLPHKPTPYSMAHGGFGRRVNPRWLTNLEYFVDLDRTVPNILIGAPGTTYWDYSPNHYTIQTNATILQYQCDAFGVTPWLTSTSSGDASIGDQSANPATPTSAISMCVWGRGTPGNWMAFLIRGISTAHYSILANSTPQIWFSVSRAAGGNFSTQIAYPTAFFQNWHFYALAWDNTTLYSYIDGALVSAASCTGGFGTANLGKWQSPGCFTDTGNTQVSSVRYPMVWHNRMLGPSDFYDLYTRGPFGDNNIEGSMVGFAPPLLDTPTAPSGGGPYIKVKHGGTDHGGTVRAVSANFTCNYDDFLIEVDTTGGDRIGYLPGFASWLGHREFIIANVGTHYVGMYDYAGGTIGPTGATSVLVAPGTTKRFVCGASKWQALS